MNKFIYTNILLAAFYLTGTSQVYAESTGWVNLATFKRMDRTVYRQQNKIPVSIKCKQGKVNYTRDDFLFKVEYQNNPGGVGYRWATGQFYKRYKNKWQNQGYKLVSYDKWVRSKSGLVVHCAIFHKKSGDSKRKKTGGVGIYKTKKTGGVGIYKTKKSGGAGIHKRKKRPGGTGT